MKLIRNKAIQLLLAMLAINLPFQTCLFAQKQDRQKSDSKWEMSIGGGASQFIGTFNLYPDDFMRVYRTDGNKFGFSIGTRFGYNINKILSIGMNGSYNKLTGVVTYLGRPEQLMEYIAGMAIGAQGQYKTNVISLVPTVGVNLIELYNTTFSFRSYGESKLNLSFGFGLSKTTIEKTAFKSYDFYYDIKQSESTEYTGYIGFRYQKRMRQRFSLYCDANFYLVNTMKLDGYYIAGEQKYEALPSESLTEEPPVLEGYMNLHVGIIIHFFNKNT